jgi:glycosyltransferase involved in cell wall biosynthesis
VKKETKRLPIVAFVSDAIYPYNCGGKELRYHELTKRLVTRAEVHIYTMRWWHGKRVRAEGDVTFHAISPLIPLYTKGRRSFRQAIVFAVGCLRLLLGTFDVLEADHMPYFQIFALRLVASIKRKRFVVTWHEVWDRAYWCQYLGWIGSAAWLLQWLAMRMPDHILAASPQTEERLRAILGPRASITTVPNGVDLELVRNTYSDPYRTDLIVVSRLMAHKRIGILLDVVSRLHSEGIAVTCRIVGDGPERASLHEKARALGVAHAVEFRHDVREQKDVYALMKAAKVFVFPSAREGFGISVLEALACDLPVVTTSDVDNLARHLVAKSTRGVICAPTVSALAAATKEVLMATSSQPADALSDGESWVSDYSWDAMVERALRAFKI